MIDDIINDNLISIILVIIIVLLIILFRKSKQISKFKSELHSLEEQTDNAWKNKNLNSFVVSSRKLIEKHYEESLKKHSLTIKSTIAMLILGFLFFIFGIIAFFDIEGVDLITPLSGGITSILSALFIRNLRRASKELRNNLIDLRKDNELALKIGLIAEFESKNKREKHLDILIEGMGNNNQ